MAYRSVKSRKPFERASKFSHAEVINNPKVQEYLAQCAIPTPPEDGTPIDSLLTQLEKPSQNRIRAVIAIDGSYREVPVQDRFPAATLTFFTFGPLMLDLSHLAEIDSLTFIAPEDIARLKRIQRYSFVLPTRNISTKSHSLRRSVRDALHSFFLDRMGSDPPLIDALRWLVFRGWRHNAGAEWILPNCPNDGCAQTNLVLSESMPNEVACPACGGPVYLIDALRLHERVDEFQGAGGILAYVLTTLEQVSMVHLIKALWEMRPQSLREILFIKDGPLAFFGQTAPLCTPMRELVSHLNGQPDSALNAIGLEKSGAFVDHAVQIEERMRPGTFLVLSNDYIYKYIVPGDPYGADPYGRNTYWGSKLIFRASDGNTYVATLPTGEFKTDPVPADFPNLNEILSVVESLKCSMYENALLPVALANKLVSLSDYPSARILESFAQNAVRQGS